MAEPLLIARCDHDLHLLPRLANRHGLVAGATGTGKSVTLQRMAEAFSRIGVPVFLADVKGDLSGLCQPANPPKAPVLERVKQLALADFRTASCPVVFWDVFGEQGHPVRATISEMGPLLLARLMDLNDVQTGVLNITFKVADDNGLLLLDLKDLRAMLQYVAENAKALAGTYGNVSPASVGAIQRGLLRLEAEGGDQFFGEPALDLMDFLRTDANGQGIINILAADKLLLSPQLYATFLLWMLSELFEKLPEVGDPDKPRLVFFFDEAHLLFDDAPKALLNRIEQVVRLVRSKGVGVYLVTQSPRDVPETVLGQLGNRVQHALRAFTPRDRKVVTAAAETFRENPQLDVAKAITELAVGEALVSFLDDRGIPSIVQRAFIIPPGTRIGPITPEERRHVMQASPLAGKYDRMIDRESAYEVLTGKAAPATPSREEEQQAAKRRAEFEKKQAEAAQAKTSSAPRRDSLFMAFCKSAVRSVATGIGHAISRGILGSISGGKRR